MPKFHVAESIQINASPAKVYEVVSDFGTWPRWSPWLCAEPDALVTISDNSNSVSSLYSWRGQIVGAGEIEHQVLEPGELIEDEIRFTKPFKSTSQVTFRFQPKDDGTQLTWTMDGGLPFFLFWLVPSTKTMIGMDYERGLKMLKEYIETGSVKSRTTTRGIEKVGPIKMVGMRKTCTMANIGESMEQAISETMRLVDEHQLPADGEKIAVYHNFDMKTKTFDYTAGVIVPDDTADVAGLSSWSMSPSQAVAVEHVGSYDHLGNSWSAGYRYAQAKKLKQSKVGTFEIYKNDPCATEEADLRTEIFLPLRG